MVVPVTELIWFLAVCTTLQTRPKEFLRSLALLQVLKNSGDWMFKLRVKTFSARDRHWLKSRERKIIASPAIYNSARVSPLTGSVTHTMAKGLLRDSATGGNQSHDVWVGLTHCDLPCRWAMSLYWFRKKKGLSLVISCNLDSLEAWTNCLLAGLSF